MCAVLLVDPFLGSLGFRLGSSGVDLVDFDFKFFGDGEFYFRVLSDVEGEDVFVVVSMFPDPNVSFVRSLFYVSTLKDLGARRVVFIAPYLAYGRQDKRFLSGECVSARVVVASLLSAGADLVVSVDTHNPEAYSVFSSRFRELKSLSVVADFIQNTFRKKEILVISPDKGRVPVIRELAENLNVDYSYFEKLRDLKTGKILKHAPHDRESLSKLLKVKDVVVIFDDIISTGGTISGIAKTIRSDFNFDGELVTIFTHGLFLSGSVNKLFSSGVDMVVATDSVPNPFAKITITPVILDFIESFG